MLGKALTTAAAGNAAGEGTYVEDVFSTYLYEGNGSAQRIENGIAIGDFGVGTSTEFATTTDKLTRASDLTGNTDGKTFTFSAWFYTDPYATGETYVYLLKIDNSDSYSIRVRDNGALYVRLFDGSSAVLNFFTNTGVIPRGVWNHLVMSFDMTNSSNKYIYLNDSDITSQINTLFAYVNTNIDFTRSNWSVHQDSLKAKLAHVYLDYTYRDLSTESNRRIFIDANGGSTSPSTLSALSPILYLPMTDAYTIGENLGTGGDFTSNGSPTIVQDGTEYVVDSGEGGLVWIKDRDDSYGHYLFDTERGAGKNILSNTSSAEATDTNKLGSFNSNGFSLGTNVAVSTSGDDYASWTFRKASKFFDVVTFTQTGGSGTFTTFNHNLGSAPGMVLLKATGASYPWFPCYHRSLGNDQYLVLDQTSAAGTFANTFSVNSTSVTVNNNLMYGDGATYVAYLFAHNDGDGEFGEDADQDIIKCGSFTNDGGNAQYKEVGFEPQWLLMKQATATSNWYIVDNMRGFPALGSSSVVLEPNTSDAEAGFSILHTDANGFYFDTFGTAGATWIYIAIRRGPMKTPTSATEVFDIDNTPYSYGDDPAFRSATVDVMDFSIQKLKTGTGQWYAGDRLRPFNYLNISSDDDEGGNTHAAWDYMNGFNSYTLSSPNYIGYLFRRAPGFFDMLNIPQESGSGFKTVSHNLGVAPELMILKSRFNDGNWAVWHKDFTTSQYITLNSDNTTVSSTNVFGDTAPTATSFQINYSTFALSIRTYMTYLFASVPGVSTVGSYSGDGTDDRTIDCGFSNGARFVLIKSYAGTSGAWQVMDTERGFNAGDDPVLKLNSTAAEETVSDVIDSNASGFNVNDDGGSRSTNASGVDYIFLAIA